MINILNKLTDKNISSTVESDAKGNAKIIIPINDDNNDMTEIEIFKNNKYIILMTSTSSVYTTNYNNVPNRTRSNRFSI